MSHHDDAHITPPSHWPIVGSVALFFMAFGFVHFLHEGVHWLWVTLVGALILFYMMHGWFKEVVRDGLNGLNEDVIINKAFRCSMLWFIFSEVMFFAAFFGVLFYARIYSVPTLGGTLGDGTEWTHLLLWPGFKAVWPVLNTPDPSQFLGPKGVMATWHLPALNTLILLTSGVTITLSHWALLKRKRTAGLIWQGATIILGLLFLFCQYTEYAEAYLEKGLTLGSGIYGSTFFMLTGFHGFHVTVGTIMLIFIWLRMYFNHFDPKHHFAFEAVAWYWHFVDIVWLGLFIFVYWL